MRCAAGGKRVEGSRVCSWLSQDYELAGLSRVACVPLVYAAAVMLSLADEALADLCAKLIERDRSCDQRDRDTN